jgi:hypothetical protein
MSLKSLKFHIKSDDYFGTLATVLNLINEKNLKHELLEEDSQIIKKIIKNLIFLQENYKIIEK